MSPIAVDECWKVQQQSGQRNNPTKLNGCANDGPTFSLSIKDAIDSMRPLAVHRPHLQRHYQRVLTHSHECYHGKDEHLVGRQYATTQEQSTFMAPTSSPITTPMPSSPIYSYGYSMPSQSEPTVSMTSSETRSSNLSSAFSSGRSSASIYYSSTLQSFLISQNSASTTAPTPIPPYLTSNSGANGTMQSTSTTQSRLPSTTPEPWDPLISIILSLASLEASASNHLTLTAPTQAYNATTTVTSTLDTSTVSSSSTSSNSGSTAAMTSYSGAVVVVNSTVYIIPVMTSTIAAGSAQSSSNFPSSITTNSSILVTALSSARSTLSSQAFTTSETTTLATSFLSSLSTPSSTSFATSIVSSSTSQTSTSIQLSATTTLVARTSFATGISSSSTAPSSSTSTSSSSTAAATNNVSSVSAASTTSTPTSTVVGSVVGSVAGLALLVALLLLLLRWWKRNSFAGGRQIDDSSRPVTAGTQDPSSSRPFLPPTAAALLNRLSLASFTGRPQSIPPPAPAGPPAFERISGRKLPSQFSPGIEGPTGASAYPPGAQPEMVENPFLDPIVPVGAAAAAGPSRQNPPVSSFESDRDREQLMPSPARTPVLRSTPDPHRSYLAAPGIPGRPSTPSWGAGRGIGGSPSRPDTRGSTATLGSRFREDIS